MNLCFECPVRGRCCYLSSVIHGYNVIIETQPCKLLDVQTGLCKDYENRLPHCKIGENIFGNGCLPKECLYLREHPEKELNPKIDVKEVYQEFTPSEMITYGKLMNDPLLWEKYYEVNGL